MYRSKNPTQSPRRHRPERCSQHSSMSPSLAPMQSRLCAVGSGSPGEMQPPNHRLLHVFRRSYRRSDGFLPRHRPNPHAPTAPHRPQAQMGPFIPHGMRYFRRCSSHRANMGCQIHPQPGFIMYVHTSPNRHFLLLPSI